MLGIIKIKVEKKRKEEGLVSSTDYYSHEEEERVVGYANEVHTSAFQHCFIPACSG